MGQENTRRFQENWRYIRKETFNPMNKDDTYIIRFDTATDVELSFVKEENGVIEFATKMFDFDLKKNEANECAFTVKIRQMTDIERVLESHRRYLAANMGKLVISKNTSETKNGEK